MEYEEEMDALEAIFGEEFSRVAPNACSVTIVPNCDPPHHISCILQWTFPDTYPNALPQLAIENVKGLSDVWNKELCQKLLQEASDNLLGSQMIFSLVDMAREWLTERNVAGLGEDSMHSKMMRAQYAKQMQVETDAANALLASVNPGGVAKTKSAESVARKQREMGTAVTAETFSKWMQHCIAREEGLAKLALSGKQVKLTGRQIFEQGKMGDIPGLAAGDVAGEDEGLEDFDIRLLRKEGEEEGEEEDDEDDEDDDEEEEDDE